MRPAPPFTAGGNARGARNSRAAARRLLSYVTGRYRAAFMVVLACILASALAGVIGSMFLKVLIDDYIVPLLHQPAADFSGLLRAIVVMAGVYLIGILATLAYSRVMPVISQGVMKNVRDEMFSTMQGLPVRYFDTHTFGDVMSRYTNDTDTLRQMLTQSIPQMFSSGISLVLVFCAMVYTNVWLTLLVVACAAVMLVIAGRITGKSREYFVKRQESLGTLNGYIEEMTSGQKVIKVFCHEEKAKEDFDKCNDEFTRHAAAADTFANILMPVIFNMGNLQYVLIAIVGGAMAIGGVTGMTLGAIAAFLQLSKSFTGPIGQVSQQVNSVVMALAGAERIFDLMDEKAEKDDGYVTLVNVAPAPGGAPAGEQMMESPERTGRWAWKHPHHDGTLTYTPLSGDVRLSNVDFGYVEGTVVLHDITLCAEPGQKVALVGATGAGKTTITNLLNRFYDIADGKVRYDGITITKIRKPDLRRSLGMVLQDTNLFTGTVRENIRYGRLDATEKEICDAARLANADDFIRRLPEGYDTMLSGDGSNLSQGQRQLIAIARAAVADPPVMILDEATSSIDTRTEAIVQSGMDRLMQGRTVFVIAHRLSTVRDADVILVLSEGRIIERGTHEELIARGGVYYQLYTGAFELE